MVQLNIKHIRGIMTDIKVLLISWKNINFKKIFLCFKDFIFIACVIEFTINTKCNSKAYVREEQ